MHDYCINNLPPLGRAEVERMCEQYPEVKKELQQLQNALNKFAERASKAPAQEIKHKIWNTLDNINKERAGDLRDLPLINKYSGHHNWISIVKPLMPAEIPQKRAMIPLRESDGIMQVLVISRTDVEDEVHENEKESFLVLEGECECAVGDQKYRLGPGDFREIPLHKNHNVKVLSAYVVAVLQHVAL